jgi:hypothetical protein
MLVCFGAAWPFSIYKSYQSRSTKGKSAAFLGILLVGYVAGILHKLYFSYNKVIYRYIINLIMVSADMALFFINKSQNNEAELDDMERVASKAE